MKAVLQTLAKLAEIGGLMLAAVAYMISAPDYTVLLITCVTSAGVALLASTALALTTTARAYHWINAVVAIGIALLGLDRLLFGGSILHERFLR